MDPDTLKALAVFGGSAKVIEKLLGPTAGYMGF